MKKIIKRIGQIATVASAAATLWAGRAMASTASNPAQEGAEAAKGDGMPTELIGETGIFTQITNTLLLVIGVVSIIMLIWGGLRYIISGGDSKKVTDAKNTILYAIVGLVIALLSYAIVNFVINAIAPTPTE